MSSQFFDSALTVFDAGLNGHTCLSFFFQRGVLRGFIRNRKDVYSRHNVAPMRANANVIANETERVNL